jgi:methylglutaconyl-CoA hydratase
MSPSDQNAAEGTVSAIAANGVGTVEFGHPKGNSLPGALLRRLADTIAATGARADVNVVAVRSTGTGPFCAGASFDELVAIRDEREGKEFFLGFARVVLAMIRCPKPVVTRVHGKVVGGGIGVVAASDYAIASEKAQLRLSELAVGIGPFVVGPAIEWKVGSGAFGAMAFDADWRSAEWGLNAGLYAQLHGDVAALDSAFDKFVAQLAAANPAATAGIKATLWRETGDWETLLDERAATSGRLVLSDHTRRAIDAFKQR